MRYLPQVGLFLLQARVSAGTHRKRCYAPRIWFHRADKIPPVAMDRSNHAVRSDPRTGHASYAVSLTLGERHQAPPIQGPVHAAKSKTETFNDFPPTHPLQEPAGTSAGIRTDLDVTPREHDLDAHVGVPPDRKEEKHMHYHEGRRKGPAPGLFSIEELRFQQQCQEIR